MITGNEPISPTDYSSDCGGLTIREHFAAMAMQGLLTNRDWTDKKQSDDWDDYVERITAGSVDIANALIYQLNNNPVL